VCARASCHRRVPAAHCRRPPHNLLMEPLLAEVSNRLSNACCMAFLCFSEFGETVVNIIHETAIDLAWKNTFTYVSNEIETIIKIAPSSLPRRARCTPPTSAQAPSRATGCTSDTTDCSTDCTTDFTTDFTTDCATDCATDCTTAHTAGRAVRPLPRRALQVLLLQQRGPPVRVPVHVDAAVRSRWVPVMPLANPQPAKVRFRVENG
jgi:hypothetical protein